MNHALADFLVANWGVLLFASVVCGTVGGTMWRNGVSIFLTQKGGVLERLKDATQPRNTIQQIGIAIDAIGDGFLLAFVVSLILMVVRWVYGA